MDRTYNYLLDTAIKLARRAGEVQLGFFRSDHLRTDTKINESDIVTEADRA